MELASDLVKLSLFDVILYIDDSGSMAFEVCLLASVLHDEIDGKQGGGERIDDLKL